MKVVNKLAGVSLVAALSLVAVHEGLRLTPYQDIGGVWTDCYGRTKGVKPGTKTTKEECDSALMRELIEHAKPIEKIPHKLPDNVIIAWADFCYNIGVGACQSSTGYKMLMVGDVLGSCRQMLRYKFAGGRDCSIRSNNCYGVWERRQIEYRLCSGSNSI
jgi:lysozyme